MGLTQISTAGVKDDAVTAGKIPANAVGSSELADNAVDTAAIAADAVTGAKIADNAIDSEHYTDGSIDNAHLADDAVGIAELSATGTASSSTFLRGDNSWTTVNTDLVSDTSPQLGGNLDAGSHSIVFDDNSKVKLGNDNDLEIYHDGSDSYIKDAGTGRLMLLSNTFQVNSADNSEIQISAVENGAVSLYNNGSKKFETTAGGVTVTGGLTTTAAVAASSMCTLSGGLKTGTDEYKVQLGAGDDLELWHSTNNNSYIKNSTGELKIASDNIALMTTDQSEKFIDCNGNGNVELYYDNALRLDTTTGGADIRSSGSAVEMKLRTSGGTTRGWLYANDSNQVGILDQGGNWAIMHYNDNYTQFRINNTTKVRIDGDGLKFGSSTAAANALNDYEEGTWTPVMKDQSGNTYSGGGTITGHYVKVGEMVIVQFAGTSLGNSGMVSNQILIHGIPFTPRETAIAFAQLRYGNNISTAQFGPHVQCDANNSIGGMNKIHDNAGDIKTIDWNHMQHSSGYYGIRWTLIFRSN